MADRFLIGAGGTWVNAASDIWAAISGGAVDGGGIAGGDIAILDVASGALVVNGDGVCAGLDATGYLSTVTPGGPARSIDINGDAILEGTWNASPTDLSLAIAGNLTVVAGTTVPNAPLITFDGVGANPTLTSNAVTLGPITIANNPVAGSLTLQDALTCGTLTSAVATSAFSTGAFDVVAASLAWSNGTYAGTGDTQVNGNISVTGGTWSNTGILSLEAAGDVVIGAAQKPAEFEINDVATLVGTTYVGKLSGSGTLTGDGGSRTFFVYNPPANDFLDVDDLTIDDSGGDLPYVRVYLNASRSQAAFNLTDPLLGPFLIIGTGGNRTLTMTGRINLGANDLGIEGAGGAAAYVTLDARFGGVVGDIELGDAGMADSGKLVIDGIWTIGSLASQDAVTNDNNSVDFTTARCFVRTGETLDFDAIAVTSAGAVLTTPGTATVTNGPATTGTLLWLGGNWVDGGGNDADSYRLLHSSFASVIGSQVG